MTSHKLNEPSVAGQSVTGQCYCGTVRFAITDFQPQLMTCHCTICQRVSAADCVSYGHSPKQNFSWLQGLQQLNYLQTSEDTQRPFCCNCGSQMPIIYEPADQVFVPAALLDEVDGFKVIGHCFVRSKKPWLQLPDDETQYEAFPG